MPVLTRRQHQLLLLAGVNDVAQEEEPQTAEGTPLGTPSPSQSESPPGTPLLDGTESALDTVATLLPDPAAEDQVNAAPEGSTSTVSLLALDDPSAIPLGILKRIVEKLLIDDLTRLMMTSSRLRRLAQEVLQDRVQDLLTSYRIPLHLNFLDFMRQHDLIITGHAVVRFLLGMEAKVAKVGLNILVAGDNEDLVINYLEQIDYFPILAPHVNVALNMYALSGLSRITRLASFNHDTGTFSRINILSISPSVDRNRAVAFQPTTASMSYITADTINVLFPHMTFKRQALIAINHLQPPPSHLHYNISDSLDTLSDYAALHVQKLLADGIDVRYSTVVPNFHWLRDGCHFGCASTFNRHGGGTLVAPFSEAAVSERSRHLDDLMAAHVKLLLGGLCQNVRCPTHVDRDPYSSDDSDTEMVGF